MSPQDLSKTSHTWWTCSKYALNEKFELYVSYPYLRLYTAKTSINTISPVVEGKFSQRYLDFWVFPDSTIHYLVFP